MPRKQQTGVIANHQSAEPEVQRGQKLLQQRGECHHPGYIENLVKVAFQHRVLAASLNPGHCHCTALTVGRSAFIRSM